MAAVNWPVRVAAQPVMDDRMGRVEDEGENVPLGSHDDSHSDGLELWPLSRSRVASTTRLG